ncbi:hypothetical protein BKA67DRAFT_652843 [Truncatella angustata]|uniref:Integral membrane protein n=1 Tax=Truncatella angustata TaxID=152316 RepID=A0A9P8UWS4_9PEZI|nr:uncharacterized protein BKA67DRAFT_652843 [Truncatella angustata]KAH6659618.1 hypothetical protein BKA67DRAFT_652843 [Truncatella angustata]
MALRSPVERHGSDLELDALPPSTDRAPIEEAEGRGIVSTLGSNFPGRPQVVLIKGRRGWCHAEGWRLENNLLWGVGLLELANAGDFAANVWNDVPVPVFVVILCAIGGTAAGVICTFAFADSIKAWHNIQFLRGQRAELRAARSRQLDDEQASGSSLEVLDELTKRELRTEAINRWGMDLLMGGAAVLISIGTFMAIGGNNHRIWVASNLLSGYVGNTPVLIFGLVNAFWQVVIWKKMHHHDRAAKKKLQGHPELALIRKRCFNVQIYSVANGMATIMGGVGSMLTPTFWWAYIILIPVIITSFFCNYWWRRKVGYDRPHDSTSVISSASLIDEIRVACRAKNIVENHPGAALPHLVTEYEKPDGLLLFFISHGLFEAFCLRLVNEKLLFPHNGDAETSQLCIDTDCLSALYQCHSSAFWKTGEELLRLEGPKHFRHRRRFFTELLGEHLSHSV